ncbi:MAG: GNAT family N-acetyltransferase [Chloroflexi bacterium]|nr:GNAT family N-acetyltransferase [Chloroflexota bacterium]
MTSVSIRPASRADAEVLATIQERASVAALAHIYPPERYPFPAWAVRERWQTFEGRVWLAAAGPEPVGLVGIAPPWLEGLYVDPEAWGSGAAGALHDHAVEALRAAGITMARLWVLEHNQRARRFYERRGWRPDGSTRIVPFPPHPTDVGYALPLGSEVVR